MSINRVNAARDANEPEIIDIYLAAGATVDRVYNGPCDLIVGYTDAILGPQTITVEVKLPRGPEGGTSHSRESPREMEYSGRHKGRHYIVRSRDDALRSINKLPSAIVSKGCR